MASTLSYENEERVGASSFRTDAELDPSGRIYISVSCKLTSDAAAPTDVTLYTVPDGKKFVVTHVMSGKGQDTTQDMVLYDDAGDTAVAAHSKVYFLCPDWKKTLGSWTYSPGIIFERGITIDAANQTAGGHTYYYDFQGYLI